MAIGVSETKRVFRWNGVTLEDIDASMTPEEVRDVYAAQHGELTTAEIIDLSLDEKGVHAYEFRKQVGTKG